MHRKSFKQYCIMLTMVLISCFCLTGCMVREYVAEETAKSQVRKVCRLLCSGDESGIEELLSNKAREEIEDSEQKISEMVEFVEGDYVSADIDAYAEDVTAKDKKRKIDVDVSAYLKTTAGEYAIKCDVISVDKADKTSIGLYTIAVSKVSDEDYLYYFHKKSDIGVYIDDSPKEDWVNRTTELTKTPSNVWENDSEYEVWKKSKYDEDMFNDYLVFSYDKAERIIYSDKKTGERIGVLGAGEIVLVTNRWLYYLAYGASGDENGENIENLEFLQRVPLNQTEVINVKEKETLIVDDDIYNICFSRSDIYYTRAKNADENSPSRVFCYTMESGEKKEIPLHEILESSLYETGSWYIDDMILTDSAVYLLYGDSLYKRNIIQDSAFEPVANLSVSGYDAYSFVGTYGNKIFISAMETETRPRLLDTALIAYDEQTRKISPCFGTADFEKYKLSEEGDIPEVRMAAYFLDGNNMYMFVCSDMDEVSVEKYLFCYDLESGKSRECTEAETFLREEKKRIIVDIIDGKMLCLGKKKYSYDLDSGESIRLKKNSLEYQYCDMMDMTGNTIDY